MDFESERQALPRRMWRTQFEQRHHNALGEQLAQAAPEWETLKAYWALQVEWLMPNWSRLQKVQGAARADLHEMLSPFLPQNMVTGLGRYVKHVGDHRQDVFAPAQLPELMEAMVHSVGWRIHQAAEYAWKYEQSLDREAKAAHMRLNPKASVQERLHSPLALAVENTMDRFTFAALGEASSRMARLRTEYGFPFMRPNPSQKERDALYAANQPDFNPHKLVANGEIEKVLAPVALLAEVRAPAVEFGPQATAGMRIRRSLESVVGPLDQLSLRSLVRGKSTQGPEK